MSKTTAASVKRIVVLMLAITILVSMIPAAEAYNSFNPRTHTYTVYGREYFKQNPKTVGCTVTLDGYLGEIDLTGHVDGVGKVYVVAAGSDVKFTINSNNPDEYYNFCYDKGEQGMFVYDDCGGGLSYYDYNGSIESAPIFVSPNDDGTAALSGLTTLEATGKKVGEKSYVYTMHNDGLITFAFNSKTKGADEPDPTEIVIRYNLGTFLFVREKQVKELEETGIMTFYNKEDVKVQFREYQYLYPGLTDLFGIKLQPIGLRFGDDVFMSDMGPINDLIITNNTKEKISGVYSMLIYSPKLRCDACAYGADEEGHRDRPSAEIYSIDLDLEPGESITKHAYLGGYRSLATSKIVWVEYDDAAERETYLNSEYLGMTDTVGVYEEDGYIGYRTVDDKAYLEGFPYNIKFDAVVHKD